MFLLFLPFYLRFGEINSRIAVGQSRRAVKEKIKNCGKPAAGREEGAPCAPLPEQLNFVRQCCYNAKLSTSYTAEF